MKGMRSLRVWAVLALLASLGMGVGGATSAMDELGLEGALGTAFTYQGQLRDEGGTVNDTCDLQFTLWDAAAGGAQVGSTILLEDVVLEWGLFTARLDFGAAAFRGQARYLEVGVACPAGSGFVAMPRQELTGSPYALWALGAPWSGLEGVPADLADGDQDTTYTPGTGLSLVGGQFSVNFAGNGSAGTASRSDHNHDAAYVNEGQASSVSTGMVQNSTLLLEDLNQNGCGTGQVIKWNGSAWACAADATGGTSFWSLTGNAGTVPGTNYLGTSDNAAVEIKVNGARALRIEPNTESPNVIGGYSGNWVTDGVYGATIGGGGAADNGIGDPGQNGVAARFATVAGGVENTASGNGASVGGGWRNTAVGPHSVVGGGWSNDATGGFATVAGGTGNLATDGYSAVCGGASNMASGYASFVGGGVANSSSGDYGVIGGGRYNQAQAAYTTIGGGGGPSAGDGNIVAADYATVGGGRQNSASGAHATVSGGWLNTASGPSSVIAGGGGIMAGTTYANTASWDFATIGGGGGNTASGIFAVVSGGLYNTASQYATVGGGSSNSATGDQSTVGGGQVNSATGRYATVGGGEDNYASGESSIICGGEDNFASGQYATVAGGAYNYVNALLGTVAGGGAPYMSSPTLGNTVTDSYGAVGGGYHNRAGDNAGSTEDRPYAAVGGGRDNIASGTSSVVAGGDTNTASGWRSMVPGGAGNTAAGDHSFAAGRRAKANHGGAFVWADGLDVDFASTDSNTFRVRATNGAEFVANNAGYGLIAANNGAGDGLRAMTNSSAGTNWAAVYAVSNGTSPAVYANSGGTYSGYFLDNIYVEGNCIGCTTAFLAVNDGDRALETGDLVAARGVLGPVTGSGQPTLAVGLAGGNNLGVIGVVQGRVMLTSSEKDGVESQSMDLAESAVQPGEYLLVVVQGFARIKVDVAAGPILPGQRLTAGRQGGTARALETREINGMVVSEGAPVIGVALAPPEPGSDLVPVFVNLQ